MGDAELTGLLWEGPRSHEKLLYSIAHAPLSRELVEVVVVGIAGWMERLIPTAAQNTSDLPEIGSRPPAALCSFYTHAVPLLMIIHVRIIGFQLKKLKLRGAE